MIHGLLLSGAILLLAGCGDPYEEGMQALEQEKWEEAATAFKRVPNLDKRHDEAEAKESEAYYQLGKLAHDQKDWPKVMAHLGMFGRWDTRYEEGRALMDVARFHLGQAAYEKADWHGDLRSPGCLRQPQGKVSERRGTGPPP